MTGKRKAGVLGGLVGISLLAVIVAAQMSPKPQDFHSAKSVSPAPAGEVLDGVEPSDTAGEEAPHLSEAAAARRQNMLAKIWWNQPKKVELLALSDDQRIRMDALLRSYFEGQSEAGQNRFASLEALGDALARGDEEAARASGLAIARAASEPVTAQVELMIAVMKILTPEQRQKLAEHHPKLLSRMWIRNGNPAALAAKSRRRGQP